MEQDSLKNGQEESKEQTKGDTDSVPQSNSAFS